MGISTPRLLYPRGYNPCFSLNRGLGGPRSWSGRFEDCLPRRIFYCDMIGTLQVEVTGVTEIVGFGGGGDFPCV